MKLLLIAHFILLAAYTASLTAQAQVTVGFDEPHNSLTLSVPDSPAALQIDLLHLKLEENRLDGSATRRKVQASDTRGWVFSAFLYPLDKKLTPAELSDQTFLDIRRGASENGFKIDGMKTFDRGDFSMREYIVPDFHGQPVHQKNVFGDAVRGDMGLDFHISKISYSSADDRFLESLISGIRLVPDYKPDSVTEYGYGSIFYLHEDWTRAAAHYERSLQLEEQNRTLDQIRWNVLVDNLGMTYAMSGEISKARKTFEYGTQQNPTYPMFRYNLACADSEMGDLDGALGQLKLAFEYKSHSNPGEGIPDPAKDDSFKNYLSDPRFVELTKEVCPSSTRTEAGWMCQ